MKGLSGWRLEGNQITKQFTFAGFPEAVAFVDRLVPEAEAADHHPDILINYKRVTLTYSTHSEGGLTEKDFAGARWPIGRKIGRVRYPCGSNERIARARSRALTGLTARQLQIWDAGGCCRPRFLRTGRKPAATRNAATRRSSSSS